MLANLRMVSLLTIISRIAGLLRDSGMAAAFGGTTILDAFIVAFRIPNLARQLFGEGALSTAFLPVFQQVQRERGDVAARQTLTATAFVLGAFLTAGLVIAELGIFAFLHWGGVTPSAQLLLSLLMWMLPYLVLICLAALFSAALHAQREFFWPGLVPILLNAVWLGGLLVSGRMGMSDDTRAIFLAGTVLVAGALQLTLPLLVLEYRGLGLSAAWRNGLPEVRQVLTTMLPVVAGMAVIQTSAVMDSLLAWSLSIPDDGSRALCERLGIPPCLESGTVSALFLGQRMYQFPLGVFGVALGTVLYPVLTQHAQRGQWAELRTDLHHGLRLVIAIAVPASVGLVVLAEPIARGLFQHGEFTAIDAALTARMIAVYGAGTWCFITLAILNRAYYAAGDRLTPMKLGLVALATGLFLNLMLVWVLGGAGLAVGNVLACLLQVTLTMAFLGQRVGGFDWRSLWPTLWRSLTAAGMMAVACLLVINWLSQFSGLGGKLLTLGVPAIVGVLVYGIAARCLGLKEVDEMLRLKA